MNRLVAVAVAVVGLLALAGCDSGDGPTESDALPAAELSFPGAIETSRSWSPEDHDRGVDGQDLSSEAALTRRFILPQPVAADEIRAWYANALADDGWTEPADNGEIFERQVGPRTHRIWVEVGDADTVGDFYVTYRIGFEER